MANNLQSSNLALHMDKIAYFAAGIIGLGILLVSLTSGSDLKRTKLAIEASRTDLEDRQDEAVEVEPVPDIVSTIRNQWVVPEPSVEFPTWTTERVPSLLQVTEGVGPEAASHEPPVLESITYRRSKSSQRVYLQLEGKLGELDKAEFVSFELLRQEDGGSFEPVKNKYLDAQKILDTGIIEYRDPYVTPGKTYTYRAVTVARPASGASENVVLPDEDRVKESNALGISEPIPWGFSARVFNIRPYDVATQTPGSFSGVIYLGPPEAGQERITVNAPAPGGYPERFEFGPPVKRGARTFEHQYEIELIDQDKVVVENKATREKIELTTLTKERPVVLPDKVVYSGEAAGTEDAVDAGADDNLTAGEDEEPPSGEGDTAPEGDAEQPSTGEATTTDTDEGDAGQEDEGESGGGGRRFRFR